LIPTDALMSAAAEQLGASAVASDGVHPTAAGHRVLADAWLERVER
jgi:lysophospholipase L1-like esterase